MSFKQRHKLPQTFDTLYLFYDLEIAPITFDFCWALVLADIHRKKLGLKHLQVVFVPGPSDGLRTEMVDYERVIDKEARYWRKSNLILPLTRLLPTCTGLIVCATRKEADFIHKKIAHHIYPPHYSTTFPVVHTINDASTHKSQAILALHATKAALKYTQQWIETRATGRKTIVITLRQYNYMPNRNSNLNAWLNFAHSLDPKKYFVVIVPDTEVAMYKPAADLIAFEHFTEACWNIELRAALYESCYLNLGVNNGPFALCWLNKHCRYLMFKVVTEDVPQTNTETLKKYGFVPGESPPFAQKYQKWVWEPDTEFIIKREFQAMCTILGET